MQHEGNQLETNSRLDKIEQILERFESALFGDKYNGNNGYMQRMDSMEKRIDRIEKYNAAQMWFFLGAGGLGGAGLVKVFEHFL